MSGKVKLAPMLLQYHDFNRHHCIAQGICSQLLGSKYKADILTHGGAQLLANGTSCKFVPDLQRCSQLIEAHGFWHSLAAEEYASLCAEDPLLQPGDGKYSLQCVAAVHFIWVVMYQRNLYSY
eukprot:SAG31_NODE_18_length_35375_cov_22.525315_10_plen_123_part_00